MNVSLEGKRVLITAGASGIGRVTAEAFIESGARVHICDVAEAQLSECVAALPGLGATLADVSDPVQVDRLFNEAVAHLGGLDVLVNNAGVAGPTAPVEEVTPEQWDRTMAVNINGQFYCVRRAVPLLRAAGGGSIVNLSSTAGRYGFPNRSPYSASKWAVVGFTKTLAMELGPEGIRVNAICPGAVAGPRIERVIAARAEIHGEPVAEVRARHQRQSSLHTFMEARDVAALILFVVSDLGSKINGEALGVDGNTESLRT